MATATVATATVGWAEGDSSDARAIEYLYIEANEGGGSGGHVGLRLGARVFHFEYADDGLLHLARDLTDDFVHHYTQVENRTIRATRIDASAGTFESLSEAFDRHYLAQRRQLDTLATLARERRIFGDLASGRASEIEIPAAGLFFDLLPGGEQPVGSVTGRVGELRDRIGVNALSVRREALESELRALEASSLAAVEIVPGTLPLARSSTSERFVEILGELAAVAVLEQALPLRSESRVRVPGAAGELGEVSRVRIRALREELAREIVALFDSPRPDRGRALLVAAARFAALGASLEEGRWVFVDSFSDAPRIIGADVLRRRPDIAPRLTRQARDDWEQALGGLREGQTRGGRALARLERTANELAEWQAGSRGDDVRVIVDPTVPSRGASWPSRRLPSLGAFDLARAASVADQQERAVRDRMEDLYGYDLIARNCVSEVFRALNEAFARLAPGRGPGAAEAESRRRLGGFIVPGERLSFIPFVSQRLVRERYRVAGTREIPAWREARLQDLRAQESPLAVSLRESNTLTARLYTPNPEDSFFVFFTDEAVAPRPMQGAVNLAAGLGQGLYGLARLPWDGGHTLWSGLRGAAVSLPELVFVNIRKGTNEVTSPAPEAPPGPRAAD